MFTAYVFAGKVSLVFGAAILFLIQYFIVLLFSRKIKPVLDWPLLVIAIMWMLLGVWQIMCGELHSAMFLAFITVYFIIPILICLSFLALCVSVGSVILSLWKGPDRINGIRYR